MNQNRIWCALVSLACELTAWLQMLTLTGRLARTSRSTVLHLSATSRWTDLHLTIIKTLRSLPAPAT